MLRIDDFRRLALSMPQAVEGAHMGHPDFRIKGKIFASLYGQEKGLAMVKLTPEQQRRLIKEHPAMFAPISGGWGRQGASQVRLNEADADAVRAALMTAWRNTAPASLLDESIFTPKAMFFESPAEFRAWLKKNHKGASDLIVGFHKTHTGRPTMTWPQSVAEALCFGWIDGIRRRLDAERYTIRFTPRRAGSAWSAINIRMIAELEAAGRMTDTGRKAFEARPHKTGPKAKGYSYERRSAVFDAKRLKAFKRERDAWKFFEAQPPGYRRNATWWVMSAKQEATKDARLARLMRASAARKRLT